MSGKYCKKSGIIHSESEKAHCRYRGGYVQPYRSQELKWFERDIYLHTPTETQRNLK